ncbi:hypothetical protein ACFY1U_50465 [Streptomyces sp. NPDC001351]|uniref:hypothetical protein n=1 Tax=Streptomyces sp. NPDC001351 TaxID=3364564 RepID=UPI00369D9219
MTVTDHKGWQPEPLELMYAEDLHRPFGMRIDERLLNGGAGVSHVDLAERLLADQAVLSAARNADLVVVASGLPDLHPYTPVSPFLQDRLGGSGRRFAIGEQGSAAPFTAVRIASAGHCSGRVRTAAVLIVEQSTHPARGERLDAATASDSAALLVLGEGDGLRLGEVAEVRGADPAAVGDRLARMIDGSEQPLIVVGPHADPSLLLPAGAAVHRVERATYATGVWLALAEQHADWGAVYDRIVLCETDARAPERSHLLALGSDPSSSASGRIEVSA